MLVMNSIRHFFSYAGRIEWVLIAAVAAGAAPPPEREYLVYFGTYTTNNDIAQPVDARSKGIYFARFKPETGDMTEPELAAEADNPSFLAIHPSHRFLYAVNESDKNSVSSFAIDAATGKLTPLNSVSSGGEGPCQVSLDKTGQYLLVANFGSGAASVRRVNEDGSLGERTALVQHTGSSVNPQWQTGPHAHWTGVSADNRFAIVVDLGVDKVFVYRFDPEKGSLEPNDPPFVKVKPGYGPRHFAFHPKGKFGYLLNELSGALITFAWDAARGTLREIQDVRHSAQRLHRREPQR